MALKSHMSVCPDLWSGDSTLSCRTTPNEDNAVHKYTISWLWLAFSMLYMSVCPATDGFLGLCLDQGRLHHTIKTLYNCTRYSPVFPGILILILIY